MSIPYSLEFNELPDEVYAYALNSAREYVRLIVSIKRISSILWFALFMLILAEIYIGSIFLEPNTLLSTLNVSIALILLPYTLIYARKAVDVLESIYHKVSYGLSSMLSLMFKVYRGSSIAIPLIHLILSLYYISSKPISFYIVYPKPDPVHYTLYLLAIASSNYWVTVLRSILYISWSLLIFSLSYQYYILYRDFSVYEYLIISWSLVLSIIVYVLFILLGNLDLFYILTALLVTQTLTLSLTTRDIEIQLFNKLFPAILEIEQLYHSSIL